MARAGLSQGTATPVASDATKTMWDVSLSIDKQHDYTSLKLQNDGDNAIVSGVATGGPAWDGCQVIMPPGFGKAFTCFTVTKPVPANTVERYRLTFQKPISSQDATLGVFSGPSVQAPPTHEGDIALGGPKPKACKCLKLVAQIDPATLVFVNPGERSGMHLEFVVDWKMTCTKGTGNCDAQLALTPPSPGKLGTKLVAVPVVPGPRLECARLCANTVSAAGGVIKCTGPCNKTTFGTVKFVFTGGRPLGGDRRGRTIKAVGIHIKRICDKRNLPDLTLGIVFDKKTGLVNKKASDLNGNGKPDGGKGK
jgi:hypothetical protein